MMGSMGGMGPMWKKAKTFIVGAGAVRPSASVPHASRSLDAHMERSRNADVRVEPPAGRAWRASSTGAAGDQAAGALGVSGVAAGAGGAYRRRAVQYGAHTSAERNAAAAGCERHSVLPGP